MYLTFNRSIKNPTGLIIINLKIINYVDDTVLKTASERKLYVPSNNVVDECSKE